MHMGNCNQYMAQDMLWDPYASQPSIQTCVDRTATKFWIKNVFLLKLRKSPGNFQETPPVSWKLPGDWLTFSISARERPKMYVFASNIAPGSFDVPIVI